MTINERHVIVMDFPGIKKYVFGTDRLVEIRGASALLDRMNRIMIPDMITRKYGPNKSTCIFSGGGSAQFNIDDTAENLETFFQSITGKVHQESGGELQLIWGLSPEKDDYTVALDRAFLQLETKKRQQQFKQKMPLHSGFVRECQSCSGMATHVSYYAGEQRFLCQACHIKEKMGCGRGLWTEFSNCLMKQGKSDEQIEQLRPIDFLTIGERCTARKDYTALVYGDGNAIGKMIKQIRDKNHFAKFSRAVDEAVREACYESLEINCKAVDGKIPADILLLGGDDLMVYLSADTALPFTLEVGRLFEEKSKEKLLSGDDGFFQDMLKGHGITLSFGIAFAKSHTPISIMSRQAEELLKSAKKKGSGITEQDGYTPSCIDFHLTNRFNQVSAIDCRKQHVHLTTDKNEEIYLFRGPYTRDELNELFLFARRIKKSGIASSRLHRLGEAPFKNKISASIDVINLLGRCATTEQRNIVRDALRRFGCLDLIPWSRKENVLETILIDLVEIASLVKMEEIPNET